MDKTEILERSKNDAQLADQQAAREGRVLVKSLDLVASLKKDIHDTKAGIKAMNRENISTKVLTGALKTLREQLVNREQVVKVVQARYETACAYRNFCEGVVDNLVELESLGEK